MHFYSSTFFPSLLGAGATNVDVIYYHKEVLLDITTKYYKISSTRRYYYFSMWLKFTYSQDSCKAGL